MKVIKKSLSVLFLFFLASTFTVAAELPNNSVYHIGSDWKNQNNKKVNITSLRGKVQVVAFVYTYCEHSCPIILAKLKRIEKGISTKDKSKVNFLLVSLDPKRDTPDILKKYMKEKKLNEKVWQMFSGTSDDVLEFSALLGVRYKPMNNDSKDIAHSNMITVLDKSGRIHYQMKGLDASLEKVSAEIAIASHKQK